MLPPDAHLSALLRVIHVAAIEARAVAWTSEAEESLEGQREALAKCASLTDAIHNIPLFLTRFENWNESRFVGTLRRHDQQWAERGLTSLEAVYRDELHRHAERDPEPQGGNVID